MFQQDLENYLRKYDYKFTELLAFKPSGWEYCEQTQVKRGNITIHGMQKIRFSISFS